MRGLSSLIPSVLLPQKHGEGEGHDDTGTGRSRRERKLNLEIKKLMEELDQRDNDIRMLEHDKSELRKQAEDLEKKLEHTRHSHQKQAEELHRAADQHDQTRDLLKTRTLELSGAQAFLSKADTLSGAEVIAMVEAYNQEVLQAAAFMADSFTFEKSEESEESEEMQEATREASRILGRTFVNHLKSAGHGEDPTLVQIALQACIHSFCRRIIAARHFDRSRYGHLLEEICKEMSSAGARRPVILRS